MKPAERLEDVRWMAETGECLTNAATRLTMRRSSLEAWLRRHDPESLRVLIANEPRDHNRAVDGFSISDLTGKRGRRYQQRLRARSRKVAA